MGNYEKISGTSNAIISLSTTIGVGWAMAYYISELITKSKAIILLSLIVYLIATIFYALNVHRRLKWS